MKCSARRGPDPPWRRLMRAPEVSIRMCVKPSNMARSLLRFVASALIAEVRQYRIADLARGGATAEIRCQHAGAGGCFDGAYDARGFAREAEMVEHQRRAPDSRNRVGDSLAEDVGRRAVNRLETARVLLFGVCVGGGG